MDQALASTPDAALDRLALDRQMLEALCRANGVRHLALFGSAVRADFDVDASDIDMLVAFETSSPTVYAARYFELKEGLERLSGRPLDLVTLPSLRNPYLARQIDAEKVVLYEA